MRDLLVAALVLWFGSLVGPHTARAAGLDNLIVRPAVILLGPGEEADLTVTGVYDDGSTADLTTSVVFESRDENVVIVVGATVIAVGDGETEIRVEHPRTGVRADDPAMVTVSEILDLTISPSAARVEVGRQVNLTALAELDDGRSGVDVTGVVEWESARDEVATVVGGVVTGLSVGESDLSVRDPSSGVRSENDAAVVTVVAPPDPDAELVEVLATPEDSLAIVGDVVLLTVTGVFDDETERDITSEVTFESNRPQIASVDVLGRVYAHAPGTASIRIDHPSGRSVSQRPEIWVGEMEEIHLNPTQAQVDVGATVQLTALATFDNGLGADVTERVAWSSDQASVAVVSGSPGTRGRATGVSAGVAHIAAQDSGTGVRSPASEGELTVVAPTPTPGPSATPTPAPVSEIRDLVFDPAVVRLLPGESASLVVTAVHLDGSMTDVSDRVIFRSRDTGVATVDAAGLVTAHRAGHTDVRARDPVSGRRARSRARVQVTRMLRVRVSPAVVELAVGQEQPFAAFADFDDGSIDVDVTAQMAWQVVGPEGVAEVDDGVSKGLATAVGEGRVVVRAVDPISGLSSNATTGRLESGAAPPQDPAEALALRFDPDHLVLARLNEGTVSVSAELADGSLVPLDASELSIRSLHPRVVRVRASGELVGRRAGVGFVEVVHRATGLSARLPVTVRAIERLRIDAASSVVPVGQTVDLVALATYNDGSGPVDRSAELRWRSLDPDLAEIDRDAPGRVHARREGIAIIEVSDRESRTRSDAKHGVVHVVAGLVSVSVEPSAVALSVTETQQFQANGLYSDGSVVDVTGEVDWTVTDDSVASIDVAGRLTANANGDTRVVAVHSATGRRSEGLERGFVAVGRPVVGLQVSRSLDLEEDPRETFLAAGQTARLYGLALLDAGGPIDRSGAVVWTSSQPGAVAVTQDGVVTCTGIGTAVVSIEDPLVSLTSSATLGDTTVTCSAATVDRLEVRPPESSVDYPGSRNLRAFRVFTDGAEVEITTLAEWTSGDPTALSVVSTGPDAGRVTAIEDGIITVAVTDAAFGQSASAVVTVRKVRVELRIFENVPLPDKDGVFRGHVDDLIKLKARVEYLSGVTQGVNQVPDWTSSNPSVVQMGAAAGLQKNWGRMVGVGTATITARWPADEFSPELTDSIQVEVLP